MAWKIRDGARTVRRAIDGDWKRSWALAGIVVCLWVPTNSTQAALLGSGQIDSLDGVCGNGALEPGEECESPFGNCCEPTTCQFRSPVEPCAPDDNPCTADLCDGAGVCTHAAGNPGAVCRPSGQSPVCAPRSLPAGSIELPVGISKDWFLTHECGAQELVVFPTGTAPCNAWHTYTQSPATAARLTNILSGLTSGTFLSPETIAGETHYNLVGGLVEFQTSRVKELFDSRKNGGVWTPLIAVYEGGCANVSGSQKVVGFATARLTGVQTSPSPSLRFSIDCDIIELGAPGGPNDFGTLVASCADCDIAETCTGSSTDCPADEVVAAGEPCAGSDDECAASCDGAGSCVVDNLPAGTACGSRADSECSLADSCDGAGNCNPNDVIDGTPCGDECANVGVCTSGSCSGTPVGCDDGDPCTQDSCDPDDGSCVFAVEPAGGCRAAGNSGLKFSTGGDGKAHWKWQKGQATGCEEFGAPDVDTDFDVCVYDGVGGGQYALATSFHVAANPFWEASSQCRWSYVDKSAATDGIRKFALTPGSEGRSSIALGAAGLLAPLPTPVATDRFLRMNPDVTVQMHNGAGECWESEFTNAQRNTATRFKSKVKALVTD